MNEEAQVELSTLDEERFGVRTAKARLISPHDVPRVLDFCRAQRARLLIARCPSAALTTAHALETAGGQLMDVLVYYVRDLRRLPLPAPNTPLTIRPYEPEDASAVGAVARTAFKGYLGHYHADLRLDRQQCDEVYVSWAERSCQSRNVAHEVLLAVMGDVVKGFVTLRLDNAEEGEVPLVGIAPAAQGRGTCGALLVCAMEWCRARGAHRLIISTQIINTAAQRAWSRVGFEPSHSYLTFHAWFGD